LDIWTEEVETIKNVSGIVPAMVIQPITVDTIQSFSKSGNNALGIDPSDGPLQLINLNVVCLTPSDPFQRAG
jgi:hypothetical protein